MKRAVILAMLLIFAVGGCAQAQLTPDQQKYLTEMNDWYEKWDNKFFSIDRIPALTDLLSQLQTIKPPPTPILLQTDGKLVGTISWMDHYDFKQAHRDYLLVKKHMQTMQALEERRYVARGSSEVPSSDIALRYGQGSIEYIEACRIEEKAIYRLSFVRTKYLAFFLEYLPERYKKP